MREFRYVLGRVGVLLLGVVVFLIALWLLQVLFPNNPGWWAV